MSMNDVAVALGHKNRTFVAAIEVGRKPIPCERFLDFIRAYGSEMVCLPRLAMMAYYGQIINVLAENILCDSSMHHDNDKLAWSRSIRERCLFSVVSKNIKFLNLFRKDDRLILDPELKPYINKPIPDYDVEQSEDPEIFDTGREMTEYEYAARATAKADNEERMRRSEKARRERARKKEQMLQRKAQGEQSGRPSNLE